MKNGELRIEKGWHPSVVLGGRVLHSSFFIRHSSFRFLCQGDGVGGSRRRALAPRLKRERPAPRAVARDDGPDQAVRRFVRSATCRPTCPTPERTQALRTTSQPARQPASTATAPSAREPEPASRLSSERTSLRPSSGPPSAQPSGLPF